VRDVNNRKILQAIVNAVASGTRLLSRGSLLWQGLIGCVEAREQTLDIRMRANRS